MRQTKITPGSNKMWESSRMMLPEHVRAIHQYKHERKRKVRPQFDEQQIEYFNYRIHQSMSKNERVRIVVFGEFEDREVVGVIKRVDQEKLLVDCDGDKEYISLNDLLSISAY